MHYSVQWIGWSAFDSLKADDQLLKDFQWQDSAPNHASLVVAEQFGTLESLYPGRIDLGLGRAPGQ